MVALCASCYLASSSVLEPPDPDAVARLEPGVSTMDDVAAALGAPSRVVELGDRSAWLYEHQETRDAALWLLLFAMRGVDSQSDRVWAFFDEDGNLTHLAASFEADEADFGLLPGE